MNGFANQGMDEGNFEAKNGVRENLRTFDAFPKTKTTYTTRHSRGGQWTVLLLAACVLLSFTELRRWWSGTESHAFSVEKGVGHDLQINLDIVIPMQCDDLHVNVQDAAGDRTVASQVLKKDGTTWKKWAGQKELHRLGKDEKGEVRHEDEEVEEHVGEVMKGARKRGFKKTPRLWGAPDSCRIYGSLEINKVQADFHVTARGHGYEHYGAHLEHDAFNFSHVINELSFGPFYPSLHNPLDLTIATTPSHFYRFQYFLSIVPTVYIRKSAGFSRYMETNQYAVTEQSMVIGERAIPGIFWKFDIEPILLTVTEERAGMMGLLVKIVNVVSGILVAGGWAYRLVDWASEARNRRKRKSEGMLNGMSTHDAYE